MNHIISFIKDGNDPSIDFVKGLCIIFVIITHVITPVMDKYSLFCLWGEMAVPVFLMIQVFHAYKKGFSDIKIGWVKLFWRIVWPFVLAQVCALLLLFVMGQNLSVLNEFGNLGPGAYYPYIYFQFVVLLYILSPIFYKVRNIGHLLILFVFISEALELICIYSQIEPSIYRLLAFRYFFLIFLGFLMSKDKLVLNTKTVILAFFSVLFIVDVKYTGGGKYDGILYMSSWKTFHWMSYFYVAYFLIFMMKWLYNCLPKENVLSVYLQRCGKCSYEIFLFQMVFLLLSPVNIIFSKYIGNNIISESLSALLNVIVCTYPVIAFKKVSLKNAALCNSKK